MSGISKSGVWQSCISEPFLFSGSFSFFSLFSFTGQLQGEYFFFRDILPLQRGFSHKEHRALSSGGRFISSHFSKPAKEPLYPNRMKGVSFFRIEHQQSRHIIEARRKWITISSRGDLKSKKNNKFGRWDGGTSTNKSQYSKVVRRSIIPL